MDIAKNTVSSKGQVKEYDIVRPVERGGEINVLFLGNSITRHAPAPEIGWDFDWGMGLFLIHPLTSWVGGLWDL